METLVKADIFFFVTGLAIIVLSILLAFGLFYVVKFLRNLSSISRTAREETEKVVRDIEDLRQGFREGGSAIKKDAVELSHRLREEGEGMADDVRQTRENVKTTSGWVRQLFTFVKGFSTMKGKRERSTSITTRSSSNKKHHGKKKQKK